MDDDSMTRVFFDTWAKHTVLIGRIYCNTVMVIENGPFGEMKTWMMFDDFIQQYSRVL